MTQFLRRLDLWLKGTFSCKKCGRTFHSLSFGYGKAICPDCYTGEKTFLFLNPEFILNRLIGQLNYQ